jgi:hypothetical protein
VVHNSQRCFSDQPQAVSSLYLYLHDAITLMMTDEQSSALIQHLEATRIADRGLGDRHVVMCTGAKRDHLFPSSARLTFFCLPRIASRRC